MGEINLNENKVDALVKAFSAVFGEIPLAGGAIVELFSSIIPNQRIDRIVEFIKILGDKLNVQEQELLKDKILEEDFSGLMEDITESIIRTISKDRKHHFSNIVKVGLNSSNEELIQLRLIAKTLKELNDIEIIILKYNSYISSDEVSKFYQQHKSILESEILYVGASKEEEKKHYMFKGYLHHLVSLGLLEIKFEIKEESNRVSNKSNFKINPKDHTITEFGRMVIEIINEK